LDDIDSIVVEHKNRIVEANLAEIRENYSWEHLVDQHEEYFKWLIEDNGEHRLQNLK
jgi:hypothetical protein